MVEFCLRAYIFGHKSTFANHACTALHIAAGAMCLPVSSFPNANAFAVRDEQGEAILWSTDVAKIGFGATLLIYTLVNTAGFGLCNVVPH
jgi:hypothetical protein